MKVLARLVGTMPGHDHSIELQNLPLEAKRGKARTPLNRGSLNGARIHGTRVPVEEPSTASGAEGCVWHIINILYREYSFAKVGAASGQSIAGNWFQSLHGWNRP